MGGWVKAITSGITGDKKKMWADEFRCPYHGCTSNTPFVGARPPRMKLVGRPQPYVLTFKCRWCGFNINVGVDDQRIPYPEKPHIKNPYLLKRRD